MKKSKRVICLLLVILLVSIFSMHDVKRQDTVEVLAQDLSSISVGTKVHMLEDMLLVEYQDSYESIELKGGSTAVEVEEGIDDDIKEGEEKESELAEKAEFVVKKTEAKEEWSEPIIEEKVEAVKETITKNVTEVEVKQSAVEEQAVEEEVKMEEELEEKEEPPVSEINITSYGNTAEESTMLRLINEERNRLGIPSLSYDTNLYGAAKIRCVEITRVFSHTRPDGTSCFSVSNVVHGENLCYSNSYDTQVAYQQFYNSDSHKANMMDQEFTKFACNRVVSDGLVYWVQVFGYN